MGKYDHLLSPLKVGNHLFKNRICMTPTTPQYHQEDEDWPAENTMQHYIDRARNGAALITLSGLYPFNDTDNPYPYQMRDYFVFDLFKGENHYLAQLAEAIHGFGSFCTIQVQHSYPPQYDVCAGAPPFEATFTGEVEPAPYELTADDFKRLNEQFIEKCVRLKLAGLDGIFMHMSYQQTALGRTLSPLINHRTDEYGGSFENRLRLLDEVCEGVKAACGRDFIIEAHITGEERDYKTGELIPGGWTMDDSIRLAEAMSGKIDILHLRGWNVDAQHTLWIKPDEPPYLYLAEKCMEAVTETKILTTAGHKNPDMMEAVIAEGKADLIGMARQFIADPEFVEKLYEDRADDIVPCIRCNKCFEWGPDGIPRTNRCSVNPLWGMESRKVRLFKHPGASKKVAILGGGAAGMTAALRAKERGHDVTIFEKTDKLGGQLNVADYAPLKWALRDYRDYLVHQVDKQGIEVKLNTEATPELIASGGFDIAIAAMGSVPRILPIPGIDGDNTTTIFDVYGNEDKIAKKAVVVGGGSTAVETAMHLVEDYDCDVTVLEMLPVIAQDMPPTHYRTVMEAHWEDLADKLHFVTEARVSGITDEGVEYTDAEGNTQFVPADSVVIATGQAPLLDEAMQFLKLGIRLIIVGDNRKAGSIMDLTRDAYFAASQF